MRSQTARGRFFIRRANARTVTLTARRATFERAVVAQRTGAGLRTVSVRRYNAGESVCVLRWARYCAETFTTSWLNEILCAGRT